MVYDYDAPLNSLFINFVPNGDKFMLLLVLPCICTKVSGAIDLIKDGENGILIDIGDINGLVKKMNELADDSDKARKIGEKASELYQILNKDRINKEWIDFLKSV